MTREGTTTTIEQQDCQSIVKPQPAVVGPHLHWNGDYYQECSLAERCPQPSCHAANPEDIRESRRRQSAELEAWREEYGEYTLLPPPDYRPTWPDRLRAYVHAALWRLAYVVAPAPLTGDAVSLGGPHHPRALPTRAHRAD